MQGYFGGWLDLIFQRLIEIWGSTPQPLHHHHRVRDLRAKFLAAGVPDRRCSAGPRWWAWCGPSSCGRGTSNMCAPRGRWASSNGTIMFRHMLPNAMVATLTLLPFIITGTIGSAGGARFPGLRPAVLGAVAGRADLAGQAEPAGALAGLHRFLHFRGHAVAAGLHLRRRARRLRPEKDVSMSDGSGSSAT